MNTVQCSYSGHPIDIVDAGKGSNNYAIVDIAHSLAAMPRFAGHTRDFYSVAQHSVWVSEHLPAELAMYGLLHDAARAYMMDLLGPMKRHLYDYGAMEVAVLRDIHVHHGLNPNMAKAKLIGAVDDLALAVEWRDQKDGGVDWWGITEHALGTLGKIHPLPPADAEALFLKRFESLVAGHRENSYGAAAAALSRLRGWSPPVQPFISTYTGRLIDPMNPAEAQICIEDIAVSLARMPRFGGHTKTPFSVAQHSVFVAERVPNELKLHALLHDATETYMIDMPSPIKPIFPAYVSAEKKLERVIMKAFNINADVLKPPAIASADRLSALVEARDLMNRSEGWWKLDLSGAVGEPAVQVWGEREASARFLEAYQAYRHLPRAAPTHTEVMR